MFEILPSSFEEILLLKLPGPPIAWKRARLSTKGKFPLFFDHQSPLKKSLCISLKDLKPIKNSLKLEAHFFFPLPKSWSQKKKDSMVGKPVTTKPDLDNLLKFQMDCLQGIVFEDDKQIFEISATKTYSSFPRTLLTFTKIEGK